MTEQAKAILRERFGKDALIAVATCEENTPHVRAVDAYYLDGAFYCVTYALSNKMRQIEKNPLVGLCGEWFTGHGMAENLGHVLLEENRAMMDILRPAFSAWYSMGHVNEDDPNTVLLKITLADGVLMALGERIEF